MVCSACGRENRQGRRFCAQCGAALAVACPTCSAPNEPGDQFCGECGSSLESGASEQAPAAVQSERRLVSVLFADLVGFTSLSELLDAEEVRDLLSRYFERSRQLIGRYGGTLEKFIGDAVMAVWGAPAAQEDDAERAVRAGLELVSAVADLGEEIQAPDLRARVGILTGEAAVTIGAEGQGMVAGDLVNTASRIQSVAEPGAVLVGEATRRLSEAAIAYADAGTHQLKGKEEPTSLWRALRVVGTLKGALRALGLEAPFLGRDRELRLVKELYHGSADEGKAHLVSVVGVAGVGKTRLSWEFERYIDGLAGDIWWHRGRCLAYGEGVAYWALAEMVRGRAGIVEAEDPERAAAKLRAAVAEHIPDPEERAWVEPRLAHLLGLEDRTAGDQADLFSAWRVFFERLADQAPLVMVFEDIHWADAALLDFIEYLLEWSKDHPLFILTLSRPDISDRRPTWGAAKRNFTSLSLEPLTPQAMEELVRGLVPGLPPEIAATILRRAEGVPLYAMETVRMLIDRGLLERENGGYRPTGRLDEIDVPETLHALIAARLDGLTPEERRLLQDASVLGKTFTRDGIVALGGVDEGRLEALLTSLVRKDMLSVQADPVSPERGQYGFLQDLVRKIAYDTISRKDRKAKHLAAAEYLFSEWGGEELEVVEVAASHLLEAYQAAPDAPDAEDIRARAAATLARAGDRAASLAATREAEHYYVRAAELTSDPVRRARLLEEAGVMAWTGARAEEAAELLERARSAFEEQGDSHAAARVSARLGEVSWMAGRLEQAVEQMERSFQVLSNDEPDEDLAWLAAQLGRFLYFVGESDRAADRLERALELAEFLGLPGVLSQALNSKGALVLMGSRGRPEEGFAILRHALELALAHEEWEAALRAHYNLSNLLYYYVRLPEGRAVAADGLALARRLGARLWEWNFLSELVYMSFATGDWDEAMRLAGEIPRLDVAPATRPAAAELLMAVPHLLVARGEEEEAVEILESYSSLEESSDLQEVVAFAAARAALYRNQSRLKEARESARRAVGCMGTLGHLFPAVKIGFVEATEAALALGKLEEAEELLAIPARLGAGQTSPMWKGQAARLGGRLARARGEDAAAGFEAAAMTFRAAGLVFWVAVTVLEHAEWLAEQGREEEAAPLRAEAREIFEQLKARPWLERVDRHAPARTSAGSGT